MITFHVPDMSCGHCVSSINKAVAQAAPQAKITCDLATHQVHVENADAATVENALREAGYPATLQQG